MGPLALLRSLSRHLPPLNYITIHYCYFIVVCLLSSVVFWGTSNPHGHVSYVDSLFVVVSAMTEAGLNTVNLSAMTTWQQTILFLLIICGSSIWVSIWTVIARKFVFYRRVMRDRSPTDCLGRWTLRGAKGRINNRRKGGNSDPEASHAGITSPGEIRSSAASEAEEIHPQTFDGSCILNEQPTNRQSEEEGLSNAKARNICICEYRALELLSVLVPLYYFVWQLLGCLSLAAWINHHMPDIALSNGINPWWLGIFNGVSAFNNSGMSLLDANMMPFQEAYFVLITMGLMILAGNTAYPIFLRLILWCGLKLINLATDATSFRSTKLAINLLLKDPRRIYTNLFPSRLTWWLLFMLICLNAVDWILFELLNLHNPVVGSIPAGPRVLVGLFQALAVRSGGFYVVPISQISIGVQFLYVIMMYIAVYPVVLSIRQSNVYLDSLFQDSAADDKFDMASLPLNSRAVTVTNEPEKDSQPTVRERRLTLVVPPEQEISRQRLSHSTTVQTSQSDNRLHDKGPGRQTRPLSLYSAYPYSVYDGHMNFIHQQVHGQLANDIWWLVLAVLVIIIIESHHFNVDPINFSVFNIIFEVVSAYGSVGISVGVPTAMYSFSGAWYTGSKLVLCLVMLRGRHRGLPTALDHAVRLPGHHSNCKEYENKDT